MKNTLSVIIPVYNTKEYLRECLEGVIDQIQDDDEVIIIDDSSTDGSYEFCREYCNSYKNFHLVRQQHSGLGCGRNNGLRMASKDYVIFLDSDDYWNPELISVVKQRLIEQKLDILYFDADVIYQNDSIKKNDLYVKNAYQRKEWLTSEVRTGEDFFSSAYPLHFNVQACMAVFRKEFLLGKKILFSEGIFYEDVLFSIKAVIAAENVQYISDRLYVRRYRQNSIMTAELDYKRVSDKIEVVKLLFEYLSAEKGLCSNLIWRKLCMFVYRISIDALNMCERFSCQDEEQIFLKTTIYKYILSFFSENLSNNSEILIVLLDTIRSIQKDNLAEGLRQEVIHYCYDEKKTLEELYDYCLKKYFSNITMKLKGLPLFQSDCRIGVYGMGNHTKYLLQFCKKMGMKASEVIFIDSFARSGSINNEGLCIINIQDIKDDVDAVVISSFIYEQEMYEMACKNLSPQIPVFRLYQDELCPIRWDFLMESLE